MNVLFESKRFLPLFITQFFGAFNDNVFKYAFVILITYRSVDLGSSISALAAGIFIIPSVLFSYLAGQLSDKFDRACVAQYTKLAEVILVALGSLGLILHNLPILLMVLFGFGTQSAFFAPVKYAILPQHLNEKELLSGNAYIESATFLAILTGTILGGELILGDQGVMVVSMLMMLSAIIGYAASLKIPPAPPPMPHLPLALNPWEETLKMLQFSIRRHHELLYILGISWFWFIGSILLAQLPSFVKEVLHSESGVITYFLVVFSVSTAIGSLLSARLLKGLVSSKHVPLAAIALTFFMYDLYRVTVGIAPISGPLISPGQFLQTAHGIHILCDFFALSVCGGIYSVPLYALLQLTFEKTHGARTIATLNFIAALFMVGASALVIVLLLIQFSIPEIFLVVTAMHLAVTLYICRLLPFALIRPILKLMYHVEVRGGENWHKAGDRVLIISNHTSFLDAILLAAFLPEPLSFAINTFVSRRWWMRPALKIINCFVLDSSNPMAAKSLIEFLRKDRKCVIFPEGRLTETGSLMKIYDGPGMIADKSGALILPVCIDGAQYSPFTRLRGKVRVRFFPKITLTLLPPQHFHIPEYVKGRKRRQLASAQLYDLMSEMVFNSHQIHETLMKALVEARNIHGGAHVILEDQNRLPFSYNALLTRSFVLSRVIKRLTAKNETRIGIMMPNSIGTMVCFFSVQILGRVVAMINFTGGVAQILSACKAVELKTVLTSERFVQMARLLPIVTRMKEAGIRVVYLEDLRSDIRLGDKLFGLISKIIPNVMTNFLCKAKSHDPAVILFTSGSEGKPKGTVLSHRNLLANCYQISSRVDFNPQDVVFNCLPIFHAFGLTGGTLLPMISGIKVFCYPSPLHYRIIPELIYDTNSTILFGTNTFLANYGRFAHAYDFYALRYVFAGAEKLTEDVRRLWMHNYGIRIFEGYGITETAPVISVNTAMHYRTGTVGRPLPGIAMKLEPVPGIDEGQKLYVQGPNVMLGYMLEDQPGVTQPLSIWYDTGDIVDIDEEGYITILGRAKRFAKIAGEMVSLTAIENVINALWPNMHHAIVSVPDPRKGEILVLITENETATLDALPEAVRKSGLTELYLPRRLIKVEKMPLLGTGKTDYIGARLLAMSDES